ncbi:MULTISPECIES: formate/nitrite transporter family protein [Halobacteriales]|jgi:formate/nitrite transporter FocA (FNT family)|uniref:Formate/nitrite transporter n=1 Tax=Halalkalicoccus jeotgali (strain DSM 18796 / CECT 7217 / JCM 14584 / KCTC 4019 / B3) TaxID=795797 RepID=D8JC04_HALJB|nr:MULTISPECIES: formate/nitrite transporter family protein [Halobacteria]ADJ16911.1 formate/nitrite transporter [Halalkalicoccus jeotgali B3]ELY38652.1 formate/nitrite transporter [Halalkalicoccus jeotgali B3]
MSDEGTDQEGQIHEPDRAASGVPVTGWAIGDRFSTNEIFQRLLASADEEVATGTTELLFSGIAAGFAIVLTFVGHAVGSAVFPNNGFLAAILYPLGFVYIIVGRYQLYTENTLPPVALVLTRLASLPLLLRVWGIVLFANVVGAGLGAFILANSHVLSTAAMHAGAEFTRSGLEHAWWDVFLKALFAGWLVAGVVWLGTAAQDTIARLLLIYSVFYMIAAAELYHVVTAAADALFFVFLDVPSPGLLVVFYDFWLPVLLGNTVGGVFLVALVNYGQTEQRRFPEVRELSAREVLFSWKGGRSHTTPRPYVEENEPGTD